MALREPTLFILAALAGGRLHGYGIIQRTEQQSDGRVKLDPGTLYRAIARLRNAGLLEEAERKAADDVQGRARRYYTLTPAGRDVPGSRPKPRPHRSEDRRSSTFP